MSGKSIKLIDLNNTEPHLNLVRNLIAYTVLSLNPKLSKSNQTSRKGSDAVLLSAAKYMLTDLKEDHKFDFVTSSP